MRRVLIIQGQIKKYRVPFFENLHQLLEREAISLRVGYSNSRIAENGNRDNCDLASEYAVKVRTYAGFGRRILWQPLLLEAAAADLVVVEQANKYLMSHILLLSSTLGLKRMAFWGLGENRQDGQIGISEWYRRKILNLPDWWFAYTSGTADYLVRQGVPREKITAVQNSVDTRELMEQLAAIPQTGISELKRELGIPEDAKVGVFLGVLDPVKALPFLIESAKLIKLRIPEFQLIIAGGGSGAEITARAASDSGGWIHSVGPKFGIEKARVLKLANLFMLPGRVGLAILDAFAAGLPLMTTDITIHGPECEYLEDGVNGMKVKHDVETYAKAVVDVFTVPELLHTLKNGAKISGERYSIEAMAQNFHDGIVRCLALK
jgi:glycosyltransferase involved in cell wall biosynthesis